MGPEPDNKIKEFEALVELATCLRKENKKIVHCHGVFDLLHIGHIRHFREARKFGDILLVTVTPDRFVNRGPHRPAFSETLRAEAIAALDCVDYVAINRWPSAVEIIKLLSPDFYVKGSDYKDMTRDPTGGILQEKEAIESVGGRLLFTDNPTFSSSGLINRYASPFPKEVSEYLAQFSSRHPTSEILGYLEKISALKVLVVGEAIIDEYEYCKALGKSSKDPTLALQQLSSEKFAGGALSIANHIADFCQGIGLVTLLGSQNSQEEFIRKNLRRQIHPIFLYRKNSPTIIKRRLIENYYFAKLLEVYEINDAPLNNEDDETICDVLSEEVPKYDLVIVADFGHGMLSEHSVNIICSNAKYLTVNAQANAGNMGLHTISKYPRADYITMAENELRLETRDSYTDLKDLIRNVPLSVNCKRAIVTRGSNGCLCYDEVEGIFEIPALAGRVVDRVGAGDAFLSISSLWARQNAPIEVVGFIGNAAGAQVVATVCNREPVERVALIRQVESLLK